MHVLSQPINLWSSFKQGKMSTLDKLTKCDTVLIWLGKSKFAEIKLLSSLKSRNATEEWQLLSDCITHLHDKNSKTKKQHKARSTTATNIAPSTSSTSSTKRKNSPNVTPNRESEHRRGNKRKRNDIDYRQYHNDGTLTSRSPATARKIPPKASGPSETRIAAQDMITQERKSFKPSKQHPAGGTRIIDHAPVKTNIKKEPIITTRQSRIQHKLIKEEPTIHLVHRKEKTPENMRQIVRHPSGHLCRRSNPELFDNKLPDLPTVPDWNLQSPPRISHTETQFPPINSAVNPTIDPNNTSNLEEVLGYDNSQIVQTGLARLDDTSSILSGYLTDKHLQPTLRQQTANEQASVMPKEIANTSTDRSNIENTPRLQTVNERVVVTLTETATTSQEKPDTENENMNTPHTNTPDTVPIHSRARVTELDVDTTPRTEREQNELETAEALLQLHGSDDNSQTLPVDAPKQTDFVKEMADQERDATADTDWDNDNETIIYDPTDPVITSPPSTSNSTKKGEVSFKHYGIRRRSPRTTVPRKHKCYFCDKSVNSKKELNNHHRAEHSSVTCPTCNKTFPTGDAYQRHRYVHRDPENFKCSVCNKVLPFESDLKRHMGTHTDDKKWFCTHPTCGKDFKRKADLELHAVVHSGVMHRCTQPGCKYSNLDPRNVTRHQKVHTQLAKIKCPHCDKKFVHYQQMKRHRENCQGNQP